MKRVAAFAVISASVLLIAGSAWAASPPTITSTTGMFDLGNLNEGTTGPVCPFPVGAVVDARRARQITFNGQGIGYAALQTGYLAVTLANLDTGTTITKIISGPSFLDVNGSGVPVKGTGPWLVWEPIARGGLRYFHSNLRFVPVSCGVHAILTGGTEENLCEVLD